MGSIFFDADGDGDDFGVEAGARFGGEGADVVVHLRAAMDAHGGQIVENDGEIPVDKRPGRART